MIIKPMPSPGGINREKLCILQGGKGPLNRRGMAYDSMGPTPTNRSGLAYDTAEPDTVEQIVAWAKENLTPKALHDLSIALLAAAYRAGYPTPGEMADAEDNEPTVAGKSPAARLGADSAATRDLFRRFPEIARIIHPKGTTPSTRVTADSGALAATFTRYPDLARLGPVEPARRRVPSVDSAAAKSLNERFGLDRIKSA
jgi:hypothetical protein